MKRKIVALLLTLAMMLSLGACGSSNKSDLAEVKIGVVVSDPTNSEVMQLVDYLTYLSENMPVSFKISEKTSNAEDELAFIEECATSGCQGIIGQYSSNAESAIAKCAEYEMYYTSASACKDEENFQCKQR